MVWGKANFPRSCFRVLDFSGAALEQHGVRTSLYAEHGYNTLNINSAMCLGISMRILHPQPASFSTRVCFAGRLAKNLVTT